MGAQIAVQFPAARVIHRFGASALADHTLERAEDVDQLLAQPRLLHV
jgi:hypothetical protein